MLLSSRAPVEACEDSVPARDSLQATNGGREDSQKQQEGVSDKRQGCWPTEQY